ELELLAKLSIDAFVDNLGKFQTNGTQTPERTKAGLLGNVLIVDRLEEILATHERYWEQRKDFFVQLGKAVHRHPTLSVILVSREDAVPRLERLTTYLPSRFCRFHMDLLTHDKAFNAIRLLPEQV